MNASTLTKDTPVWNVIFAIVIAVFAVFAQTNANAQTTITVNNSGKMVVGSGKSVEDVRLVSAFKKVELRGSIDIELRQGSRERVTIIGDDNIVPMVRAVVIGETLRLETNGSWTTRLKMRAIVEYAALESVAVSGSGDLRAQAMKAKEFNLSITGSGDVQFDDFNAQSLTVKISGSGDFRASGAAATQAYSIAGSGSVRTENLAGDKVKVSIAGSGDAQVWAKDTLEAAIAGSGDIRYKGKPTNLQKRVSGVGEISAL